MDRKRRIDEIPDTNENGTNAEAPSNHCRYVTLLWLLLLPLLFSSLPVLVNSTGITRGSSNHMTAFLLFRDVIPRLLFCSYAQIAVLSATEEQAPPTAPAVSTEEALGEMLEFVSNPENLWAVTKELLVAVVSHVRAPRCVPRIQSDRVDT